MAICNSIFVPIDSSENSDKSLQKATQLAKLTGAKITVIHVVDLNVAFSALRGADFNLHFIETFENAGNELLQKAAGYLDGYENVSYELLKGDPSHVLAKKINAEKPDVVIIAGRGKGQISQILIGSVAHYLLTHTESPILIVR